MAVQGFDRSPVTRKYRGGNIAPKLGDTGGWGDIWLDWAARIVPGGDVYNQVMLAALNGCNFFRIMAPTGQLLRGELLTGDVSTPGTVIYDFKQLHDLVASVGAYLYPTLSVSDGGGIHWNSGIYNTAAVVATTVALANKLKDATNFPRVICLDGMNEGNSWVQADTEANNVARCVTMADALRAEVAGSGLPVTVSQVYDAFGSNQATAPNGGWSDNTSLSTLTLHLDYIDLHIYRDTSTTAYPYELNFPFFRWRVDGAASGGATGVSLPVIIGEIGESVYTSGGDPDPMRRPRFSQARQISSHPGVFATLVWCIKSAVTVPGAGGPEDLPQFTFGIYDATGAPYTGAGDVRDIYQQWPKLLNSGQGLDYYVIDALGFTVSSSDPNSPTGLQVTTAAFPVRVTTTFTINYTATIGATGGGTTSADIYVDGVKQNVGVTTATAAETLTRTGIQITLAPGYHTVGLNYWGNGVGSSYGGGTPGTASATGFTITSPSTPSNSPIGGGGITGFGVTSGVVGPGRIRGG